MRVAPLLWLLACGPAEEPEDTDTDPVDDTPRLSDLGLLSWDGEQFAYSDGVLPYDLNTPLFSDYAVKRRAIYVPDGETASYGDNAVLDFPVGTVILKSFLFPADLRAPTQDLTVVETRVLTRTAEGWENDPYLWDEDQSDAVLAPSGDVASISITGLDGEPLDFDYLVPQRNQCADCHELKDGTERYITPIGPRPRYLNREHDYESGRQNQLQAFVEAGWLQGLPPLDDVPAATDFEALMAVDFWSPEQIEAGARDYLDINCAHCHNPNGTEGVSSQLFLNWDNEDPFHYGVCKKPGSAGHGTGGLTYDIVPGEPDQSILYFRMETTEIGAMMPDIGRALAHDEALALVAAWIEGLEGECSE